MSSIGPSPVLDATLVILHAEENSPDDESEENGDAELWDNTEDTKGQRSRHPILMDNKNVTLTLVTLALTLALQQPKDQGGAWQMVPFDVVST